MDDELRRLGRAARDEVETGLDVDAALDRVRTHSPTVVPIDSARRSPRPVWIMAVAAAAVAVIGGALLLRTSDSIESIEPADTTGAEISAPTTLAPVLVPSTSNPASPSSAPSSTAPATSTTAPSTMPVPAGELIAVDGENPPPPVALSPLGSVEIEPGAQPDVAIGELGVAVNQPQLGAITVLGFDGQPRTIELDAETTGSGLFNIVYGPGDVVYALRGIGPPFDFEMVAIPLSGDRVGTIVARSEPLGATTWIELPPSPFGHGQSGIVARTREVGRQMIGHVDVDGNPTELTGVIPHFPTITNDLVVETENFLMPWQLSINGRRTAEDSFTGPAVPAPTTGNRTVYATHFGSVGADVVPAVMAILESDGSGRWVTIPDGFDYVASDGPGTVFGRLDGSSLELALLDDGPKQWRSLPWERAGFDRACSDDASCTQLLVDADGSTVTYDPTTRTLTRHTTPAAAATVPDTYGAVYLTALGPDHVAYLVVDPAVQTEFASDVVAVSLDESDAGRELARWDGITNLVGDSELVATENGLVNVNCCGPDTTRPAPDAEVLARWIDRSGETVVSSHPMLTATIEFPELTIRRGDMSWTLTAPDGWQPRGMPNAMATFDGGFVASLFGTTETVVRGWPDGTVEMIELDNSTTLLFPSLDPSGRFVIPDGDRFARIDPFTDRNTYWDGATDIDAGGTGAITVTEQATARDAFWETDPVAFADAYDGPLDVNERRTIVIDEQSDARVVLTTTTTDFFDDSVFGTRAQLELDRGADGVLTIAGGTWTNVCQPGRGHQDFSPDFCV